MIDRNAPHRMISFFNIYKPAFFLSDKIFFYFFLFSFEKMRARRPSQGRNYRRKSIKRNEIEKEQEKQGIEEKKLNRSKEKEAGVKKKMKRGTFL